MLSMTLCLYLAICFSYCVFLIKILPASPAAQPVAAAIPAQCRARQQFESEGTSEGHLVQPPAPSRAKSSIREGCWRPFLDSVKISSNGDCTTSLAGGCALPHSSWGAFLSLGPTGISLTETRDCCLLSSCCKVGQTLSPL